MGLVSLTTSALARIVPYRSDAIWQTVNIIDVSVSLVLASGEKVEGAQSKIVDTRKGCNVRARC